MELESSRSRNSLGEENQDLPDGIKEFTYTNANSFDNTPGCDPGD